MNKLFGHLKTVFTHKHKVFVHCCKAGIPMQGLLHDLSKFAPVEFIESVKYYQGFRSPNDAAREANGISYAAVHHKGVNKHHFEHWTDYDMKTHQVVPVPMPTRYVIEMFCDRVAASKTYLKEKYTDDQPYLYFMKLKGVRRIHPQTSDLLESMLKMLAEKGEKEAFAYIRTLKK